MFTAINAIVSANDGQGRSAGSATSQGRSDGQAFSSQGRSTGPASSTQVRTSFRQSPSANSALVGDQQFFGASPFSSQNRQRSSFSQQPQTPSFLPSVSPNNLGSDLFALGADSNSVGGL